MTQRISPALTQDDPAIEALLARVQARMGFVPNSMRVMAHWPDLLNAFSSLATTVLGPGLLDPAFIQLVAFVTSNAAGCRYCQAHTAHGAHGRGVDEAKLLAAFEFDTSPHFSPSERAALRVAAHGGVSPSAVDDADFDELRRHFSEPEMVELTAIISLFGFLNRWNDTLATALEPSPTAFAAATLAGNGWKSGKHAE